MIIAKRRERHFQKCFNDILIQATKLFRQYFDAEPMTFHSFFCRKESRRFKKATTQILK